MPYSGTNQGLAPADVLIRRDISQKSWLIGAGPFTADALEFAPSTAAGGTTFNAPVLKLTPAGAYITGALSVNGVSLASGSVINVKAYGAVGDGTTDDSTAIVNALAAVPATGGTLYFPTGTYKTTAITLNLKNKLTILGDGRGSSTLKSNNVSVPPGSQVLVANSNCSDLTISGLTFDGSCTQRKAGQQAVIINASRFNFFNNEIINSGEYAIMVGYSATVYDAHIHHNLIGNNFADGINLQNVIRGVVDSNIVSGADDDCIAIGYSGGTLGICNHVIVSNNICRARTDLGTTWGRGILVLRANNVLITGNLIENTKQHGIYVLSEDNTLANYPTNISIIGNRISDCCVNSGQPIAITRANSVAVRGNVIVNPLTDLSGLIELADWSDVTVADNVLTQSANHFCRGIHADEGTGWGRATWDRLRLQDNTIVLTGAATNSGVYLDPNVAYTQSNTAIVGNLVDQVTAGEYLRINRTSVKAVVRNNVSVDSGNTYNWPGSGVAPVTANNT